MDNLQFYNDADVAAKFRFSRSWVRGERHKRKHGQPHTLKVDPRMVGGSPRYLQSEIDEFMRTL